MSSWLSSEEMKEVAPAESAAFRSPVPTQVVSNGEYNPLPQTAELRQVEGGIVELAGAYGKKLGMRRHEFLRTASGMAAAFLAMNHVYGPIMRSRFRASGSTRRSKTCPRPPKTGRT